MGKTRIDWATDTINVLTGCYNTCEYCYARRFAKRLAGRYGYPKENPFQPTFHPDKLLEILKLPGKGKRVFLNSMGDWFSPDVKQEWLDDIIAAVAKKPEHTFLVLTKRPDRIQELLNTFALDLPKNLWMGVSITRQQDRWRLDRLMQHVDRNRFVSFEPLQGYIGMDLSGISWAIIGAETGNRKGKIVPEAGWIDHIAATCAFNHIPLFIKDNAMKYCLSEYPTWDKDQLQAFPEGMR